jgi:hypothetical protein
LTTLDGRSMTSPAAIWSTTWAGKTAIRESTLRAYHSPLIAT